MGDYNFCRLNGSSLIFQPVLQKNANTKFIEGLIMTGNVMKVVNNKTA